jgi:hypothetical protein
VGKTEDSIISTTDKKDGLEVKRMGEYAGSNSLLGELHIKVKQLIVLHPELGYKTIREYTREAVKKQLRADGVELE